MREYRIPPSRITRVNELIRSPGKKAKASVTIARGLLDAADDIAGQTGRSALVERAVRHYLRRLVRRARHERELALLNAHAAQFNREAGRALADQVALEAV
jgi:metal-responsive CopG/Arc/MetJ family transcriptional regulator